MPSSMPTDPPSDKDPEANAEGSRVLSSPIYGALVAILIVGIILASIMLKGKHQQAKKIAEMSNGLKIYPKSVMPFPTPGSVY